MRKRYHRHFVTHKTSAKYFIPIYIWMGRCTYRCPTRNRCSSGWDLLPIIYQVVDHLSHLINRNPLQRNKPFKQRFWNASCRKNPTEFQPLFLNDLDALKKSNYNPNAKVKFFFTGWGNDGSIAHPSKDGNCVEYTSAFSMWYNWLQNELVVLDNFSTILNT